MNQVQQDALDAFVNSLDEFNPPKAAQVKADLESAFDARFVRIEFAHSNIMWNRILMLRTGGKSFLVPFAPAIKAPTEAFVRNLSESVFADVEVLCEALNAFEGVFVKVTDCGSHIYLDELHLSPSFRGQGLGGAFLDTIIRFASQQGKTLDLNILESGDGFYTPGQPEFKAYAEAHQAKLNRFYLRHGFTINPDWALGKDNKLGEYVILA